MTHQTSIVGLFCVLALSGAAGAQDKPAAAADPAAKPAISAEDKAVNAKLDRVLPEVNLGGVGLGDVIDFLRDVTGVTIVVQWKRLDAAGITKDAPVTFRGKDVTLRAALAKVLAGVGTDRGKAQFTVEEGQVVISTVPDPKRPRAKITVTGGAGIERRLPELNFKGQGLADVIDFVSEISGVKIAVDWTALEKAGIAKDAPVTIRLMDLKFSTAIERLLDDVSDGKTPLRATFEKNVLTITTAPPEAGDGKPAADKAKARP